LLRSAKTVLMSLYMLLFCLINALISFKLLESVAEFFVI